MVRARLANRRCGLRGFISDRALPVGDVPQLVGVFLCAEHRGQNLAGARSALAYANRVGEYPGGGSRFRVNSALCPEEPCLLG